MTTAGWSCLVAGEPWAAAEFELSAAALTVRPAGAPGPTAIALATIVGLDHLGNDPEGRSILEFALGPGGVVHARVPDPFVDQIVEALQQSRTAAPEPQPALEPRPEPQPALEPPPEPGAAGTAPVDEPPPEPGAAGTAPVDEPPPPRGKGNSKSALAAELAELRAYVERLGFPERAALRADIEELRADVESLIAHRTEVLAEVRAATLARREQEVALVRVRRESVLQDAGVYRPRHPAEDSVTRHRRLAAVQKQIDEIVRSEDVVRATDDWTVNGSRAEGLKVVGDLAKLLLRTYNAEADLLVATIRPYELDAAIDRLAVTLATVHRLGASMQIEISDDLHRLRVEELTLAADELAARDEIQRRAFEDVGASEVPGYLVVTSNRGALGDDVVRIAVTRLDDHDAAVAEADGGRLPFRSDLHALVPSADPDALLGEVRSALDAHRVNLTDPACPFFALSPESARDELIALGVDVPWFTIAAPAEEWHQTRNARAEND